DPADRARVLDHGALHAEADPEVRHAVLPRPPDRADLALHAPIAEAARHQQAVDRAEVGRGAVALHLLGVDPPKINAGIVGDAAVHKRFGQALVGVLQLDVLPYDGDPGLPPGRRDLPDDILPSGEVDRPGGEPEQLEDDLVEAFPVEDQGHFVDRVDVL